MGFLLSLFNSNLLMNKSGFSSFTLQVNKSPVRFHILYRTIEELDEHVIVVGEDNPLSSRIYPNAGSSR